MSDLLLLYIALSFASRDLPVAWKMFSRSLVRRKRIRAARK